MRPITGIREHHRGRQVVSWLGPYRGYGLVDLQLESGDLHGRSLGAAVGGDAWVKAQSYIRPFNTGPL